MGLDSALADNNGTVNCDKAQRTGSCNLSKNENLNGNFKRCE